MWTYGAGDTILPIPDPSEWETPGEMTSSYTQIFGDPCPGRRKEIVFSPGRQLFGTDRILIRQDTPFRVRPDRDGDTPPRPRVGVVYFANLFANPVSPSVGMDLVMLQVTAYFQCGIPAFFETHLVLCGPPDYQETCERRIGEIDTHGCPIRILYLNDNLHEYPGIYHLWGLQGTFDILLYFHSKGMSRYHRGWGRESHEIILMEKIIRPWEDVLSIFHWFPSIEKLGAACSNEGWIWHNVFWVRGAYLAKLEAPVITPRRHYYEDWLSRVTQPPADDTIPDPTIEKPRTPVHYRFDHANCFTVFTYPGRCHIGDASSPHDSLRTGG